MKLRLMTALLLALTVMIVLSGCRGSAGEPRVAEPRSTIEPTTEPEPTAETTDTIRVYFVRSEKIAAAAQEVSALAVDASPEAAAVQALLTGPTSQDPSLDFSTAIPAGTRLNGIEVKDGTATVDLSKEFASGGGSLSMQLRVAQVVFTLTQIDTVKRVAFELEGEPTTAIGGEGLVVDPPVDRGDFENVTPAILVESPLPGETISSPFTASGTSNVFEATHQIQLLDSSDRAIAGTFVTATSGTGTRGTWEQELEYFFQAGGEATLRVFESSAENGKPINIVEIPVVLSK